MLKTNKLTSKLLKKSTEEFDENFYDDDFEDFEFGDGDGNHIDEVFATPTASQTPSTLSVSPATDSGGNNVNTKSSDFADCELISSLESEYTYGEEEEEEDSAGSQNYDFRLFREVLEEVTIPKPKRYKNGTRKSMTFSNQRAREIERHNQLLLGKIMKNGPSGDGYHNPSNSAGQIRRPLVQSAAEVNRRKKQQKIEYENQMLKRKLDKIAARRSQPSPLP